MGSVIAVLKEMGATDVKYVEASGKDDVLEFEFRGNRITLRGVHCNDSTGGIDGCVESVG